MHIVIKLHIWYNNTHRQNNVTVKTRTVSAVLSSHSAVFRFRWRVRWTKTSLWRWPAPTPPRSSTCTPARVVSPWAQTLTWCCGTQTSRRSSLPRATTRYELPSFKCQRHHVYNFYVMAVCHNVFLILPLGDAKVGHFQILHIVALRFC